MRNSNTNNWRSTALIAGAILTAGVVTTTSTIDVHADNSQNNAQVSNVRQLLISNLHNCNQLMIVKKLNKLRPMSNQMLRILHKSTHKLIN